MRKEENRGSQLIKALIVSVCISCGFLTSLTGFKIASFFHDNLLTFLYLPSFLFLFSWLLFNNEIRTKISFRRTWLFYIMLYIVVLLPRAYNYTNTFFIQLLSGIIVYYIVCLGIKTERALRTVYTVLSMVIMLCAVLALLNRNGKVYIETYLNQFSLFKDYSVFSIFIFLGLSLICCHKKCPNVIKLVTIAVSLFVILLSGSRKSIIYIPWIVYLSFFWKQNKRKSVWIIFFGFVLFILLFGTTSNEYFRNLLPERAYSFITQSAFVDNTQRIDITAEYLRIIANSFGILQIIIGKGLFTSTVQTYVGYPHNYLVASLYDGGIVGLFIMIAMTWCLVKEIIKTITDTDRIEYMNIIIYMGPILIVTYLISGAHIIYSLYFWVVMGLYKSGVLIHNIDMSV